MVEFYIDIGETTRLIGKIMTYEKIDLSEKRRILAENSSLSGLMPDDTWAAYEQPIDFSTWPLEWIRQLPKDVREGKQHPGIESMWLTKH